MALFVQRTMNHGHCSTMMNRDTSHNQHEPPTPANWLAAQWLHISLSTWITFFFIFEVVVKISIYLLENRLKIIFLLNFQKAHTHIHTKTHAPRYTNIPTPNKRINTWNWCCCCCCCLFSWNSSEIISKKFFYSAPRKLSEIYKLTKMKLLAQMCFNFN